MPELLVDVELPWSQGTSVYASVFQLPWAQGTSVYGPTGTYTPGTPPVGTVPTTPIPQQPGSVIPARTVYAQAHTFSLTDERDASALDASSITISTDEDSIFWTLNAQGGPTLYAALTSGEQPSVVLAEINGRQWRFVIDQVSRTRQFGAEATSVTGRSPTVLAGLPYERVQNFSIEVETTANQIMVTANAFTDLEIDWQLLDWNVPARVFSLTGTPLDVVRSVAASVGAVVQSDRLETKVRILPRFPVLPGEWSCVVPDVEIAFEAMITESFERIEQADYDGVYLSGQQQGLLGFVRLQGTNGGKQHPLVTDVLLTAEPALLQRGAAILGASGAGARCTASLPVLTGVGEAGVLTVGQLCRVQDPDLVWWGLVQSVSVAATAGNLRQTVGFKRATVATAESVVALLVFDETIPDQSGTVGEPFSLPIGPFWTGGEGDRTYSLRRGPLPPGIAFNQALGTLAGTPTTPGTFTPIAIRAIDAVSNQADSNDFAFTVTLTAVEFAGPVPEQLLTLGVAYSFDLSSYWTSGTPPYTWSLVSGTLPTGVTLNSATGVLSGTPTAESAPAGLVFRATDSTSQTADSNSVDFSVTATLLLSRFNGTNGQTTGVVNEAPLGSTWVLGSDVSLSTLTPVYGTAALRVVTASAGDRATIDNANFALPFGTERVWEFQLIVEDGGTTSGVVYYGINLGVPGTGTNSDAFSALISGPGSGTTNFALALSYGSLFLGSSQTLARNTRHHIAISVSSNQVRAHVNGLVRNTPRAESSLINNLTRFRIEQFGTTRPPIRIDDMRFRRDVAYTSNFTPPGAL